jgi:hypothetical protein
MTQDPRIELSIAVVSKVTGVPIEKITGEERDGDYSNAKKILSKLLKDEFGIGCSEQGKGLGRTHATIINRIKTVENLIINEPPMKAMLDKCTEIIRYTYQGRGLIYLQQKERNLLKELAQLRADIAAEQKLMNSAIDEHFKGVIKRDEFHIDA